jgi:TonB family protein
MLLASLVVHLLLWPVGDHMLAWTLDGTRIPLAGGVMEVALLPVDGADEQEAEEEERPEREEREDKDHRRLVKLDWLERERTPEDAKFLSEFDSSVDKEMRAPTGRDGAPAQPAYQPGDRPDATGSPTQSTTPPTPLPLSPARSSSHGEGAGAMDPMQAADDGSLPQDPGRAGSSGVPGLRGSPATMRQAFGTPGSYDDLRGLEEGEETLLNSRRWRFASFFNRLRDAVAQNWHPEQLHAARDPEGRIHGTQTRVTRLFISLHPDGSVARIRIDQPCGVDYLDEEAIRAVRAAQPFSNPPPQLVDPNTGTIDFGFGFIFEIRSGGRIFRYQR